MEHNLYRPKPNTYKILKYLNQEMRETGNIKCPLNEDAFSQHYTNLWTDANYDQKDRSSCTYDNDVITIDEPEETIKNLKNGTAPGEANVSSELYRYASVNFILRLVNVLNNIYANGTIPREWNNATVVPFFKKFR
jgi:hypothetical protein